MSPEAAAATYALIGCNLIVSLYALYGDRRFSQTFAFQVDAVVRRQQTYHVMTSSVLRTNLPHLALDSA